MSLSVHNAPANAVSAGMAWSPPVNNHNHQHSAGDGCSSSGLPAGFVAPSTGNNTTRGELSGDNCMTIDLFCNSNILSAVWSEERNQCSLINDKTQAILNLSDNAIEQLSGGMFNTNNIDPNEMLVGRNDAKQTSLSTYYPLSELNAFNGSSGDTDIIPLESLIAPLILYTEQTATSKIKSTQAAFEETKGKKGKKAKKTKKNISLIIPCGYDQNQTCKLILATAICDYQIKSMFNRGVATIAGSLYRSPRERGGNLTLNKQNLSFILEDYAAAHPTVDPVVFYFRVYSLPPSNTVLYFDAALVRCEGSAEAKEIGNMLGFERLCTLATSGGSVTSKLAETGIVTLFDVNDDQICGELMGAVFQQLVNSCKVDKSQVCVVSTEGILAEPSHRSASPNTNMAHATGSTTHSTHDVVAITEALGLEAGSISVVKSLAQDAVTGGCLLAAGELDSSKQYIQVNDVWRIAQQLPIADGLLQSVDIGLDIQWTERKEGDLSDRQVEVLFRKDQRVWKADIGHVKPTYNTNPSGAVIKKEFKWGSAYFSWRKNVHGHVPVKGFPKVHILQRVVRGDGQEGEWTVIKSLTPLVAKDSLSKYLPSAAPVEKCDLLVSVNAGTGIVEYTENQGRTVSEVRTSHRSWISLALLLLSPFILYGLFILYGDLSARYTAYQHVQWLTDFYVKNAPEKLKSDPTLIARTMKKYEGRMFLLWRGLEKTYKVKWAPPFSIVEDTAGIEL